MEALTKPRVGRKMFCAQLKYKYLNESIPGYQNKPEYFENRIAMLDWLMKYQANVQGMFEQREWNGTKYVTI